MWLTGALLLLERKLKVHVISDMATLHQDQAGDVTEATSMFYTANGYAKNFLTFCAKFI